MPKPSSETSPAPGPEKKDASQRSQTLVRGLEIIESLVSGPASIAWIAAATGLTYPTAHRFIQTLVERRYLRPVEGQRYGLGPKLVELGFAAHGQNDLVRLARPWLEDLARRSRDAVHLARREGNEVVYLDKFPGARAIEISSRVGGRKPVISTGVGKALLLDEGEDTLHRLYETDYGLMTNPISESVWMERMERYRAGGYAFDLGEDDNSVRCVAAPLRDASGKIVGGISVSSAIEFMDGTRMTALIKEVKEAAAAISAELGHDPKAIHNFSIYER